MSDARDPSAPVNYASAIDSLREALSATSPDELKTLLPADNRKRLTGPPSKNIRNPLTHDRTIYKGLLHHSDSGMSVCLSQDYQQHLAMILKNQLEGLKSVRAEPSRSMSGFHT